jgi:Bacterial conjugation TrbI-like protein
MNNTVDKTQTNGNAQSQPTLAPLAGKEGEQAPSAEPKQPFVAEKKKAAGRENWRAIFAGVAIVGVILVTALTHKSGTTPKSSSPGTKQSTKGAQQQASSPYGSTTPVNDVGSNAEKPQDGSKIGPGAIASTAKPRPKTTAKSLSEVPPFGDSSTWQPPAFQGGVQPIATNNREQRSDHDTLDKPSLVFVRSTAATVQPEGGQTRLNDVEPTLGLAPGTRLRAHLESAVNTAVKTPVVAVVEYNYERDGEIIVPAGAKVVGHLESADRSGYVGVRFDTLLMPTGTTVNIQAAATDLQLRPLRGKVQGKNTGKNVLVRSLAGVGEVMATLVGQGGVNQPLSEADLLRGRVVSNIGQASDEELSRLAVTERLVVSVPASTEIYVVLEKQTLQQPAPPQPQQPLPSALATEQLRQLLELQKELNQTSGLGNRSQ